MERMYYHLPDLFPAYAGVILRSFAEKLILRTFPRIRGGDPQTDVRVMRPTGFSPHTRGLQKRTTGATESEMIFLERRTLQFYRPPRLRSKIPASDRASA